MNPQRQGEIARLVLKYDVQKQGIKLSQNELLRELGNVAKAIRVDEKELREFTEILVREMVDDVFGKPE